MVVYTDSSEKYWMEYIVCKMWAHGNCVTGETLLGEIYCSLR